MRIKVQVIIDQEDGLPPISDEIVCLQRGSLSPEFLGLTINESKQILERLQRTMTNCQIAEYISLHRTCPKCKTKLARKSTKNIIFRSVFGVLHLFSPRFKVCSCTNRKKKVLARFQSVCQNELHLNFFTFKQNGHL